MAAFRQLGRDVSVLSRLQLSDAVLERLGQKPSTGGESERPDVVFYTGCNVLKTPHIALLCLDVLDALAVSYRVMGGPTHCCGVQQLRAGDTQTLDRDRSVVVSQLLRAVHGGHVADLRARRACAAFCHDAVLPVSERQDRSPARCCA